MNQIELVKRAWQITWRYRVLWLFGILLALTGGGGGSGGSSGWQGGADDFRRLGNLGGIGSTPGVPGITPGGLIALLILCCCLLLIVLVVALIVRYVARVALYRMVDGIEATGSRPAWREGFRLGWSSRTVRLFLLELLVGIPTAAAILLLIGLAAAPVLLLGNASETRTLGIVLTVFLGLLAFLLIVVAAVVLSVLGQFWSREIALGDQGIGRALAAGYWLVRRNLRDVGVLWLLLFGIGLAYFVVSLFLVLAVLFVGLLFGGGLGYALYAATQSVALGVVFGLLLFLPIVVVPLVIVQGVYLTWESSVWTLAYREVAGRERPAAPALEPGAA